VAGILTDGFGDGPFCVAPYFSIVEEFQVFAPRNRDECAQVELLAEIEKPLRGHVVHANQVDSGFAHEREVATGLVRRAKMRAIRIGRERAVGNSFNEELLIAFEKELCACAHPMIHGDTATEVNGNCRAAKMGACGATDTRDL